MDFVYLETTLLPLFGIVYFKFEMFVGVINKISQHLGQESVALAETKLEKPRLFLSFFFVSDQPTFTIGRAMGNETFYFNGLNFHQEKKHLREVMSFTSFKAVFKC